MQHIFHWKWNQSMQHIFHWKWNQSMDDDEQGIHEKNSQSCSTSNSKSQVISS